MDSPLDCRSLRRFGVEIEVNTLNGVVRRPDAGAGEIPVGADYICDVVRKMVRDEVTLQGWDHVHNNRGWVIKPDNSCGIEINSPVLKGWRGLKRLLQVIDALKGSGVRSDDRCSLHIHVNISDLSLRQLATVIAYYIKCEPVFFDAVPAHRKSNRYCQPIGMTDLFTHDYYMEPQEIVERVSHVKYYSLNAYHFMRGGGFSIDNPRKKTLEFRIIENGACLDSFATKNWVRLFLHFVDVVRQRPMPRRYRENDPWSSLLWLNPKEVFTLLRFDGPLSPGLTQVRNWFADRLLLHTGCDLPGVWSWQGRSIARQESMDMVFKGYTLSADSTETWHERVYGKKYVV